MKIPILIFSLAFLCNGVLHAHKSVAAMQWPFSEHEIEQVVNILAENEELCVVENYYAVANALQDCYFKQAIIMGTGAISLMCIALFIGLIANKCKTSRRRHARGH